MNTQYHVLYISDTDREPFTFMFFHSLKIKVTNIKYSEHQADYLQDKISKINGRLHSIIISMKDYNVGIIDSILKSSSISSTIKIVKCHSLLKAQRIELLKKGIDDVITNHIDGDELAIKTLTLIQHFFCQLGSDNHLFTIRLGKLQLDPESKRLQIGNEQHALTDGEHQILLHLIGNQGRYSSRLDLSRALGKQHHSMNSRSIDVLIGRLRKKLSDDPKMPEYIVTSRGKGYMLVEQA